MYDLIHNIDWESYRLPGQYSPEISPLVHEIFNEDRNVALRASDKLSQELKDAFDMSDNELPFVLVPILIAALIASDVTHKDVFVGILTELANYCDVSLIEKLNPRPPAPHPRMLRLRTSICLGRETYLRVRDDFADEDVRRNIDYILQVCEYS